MMTGVGTAAGEAFGGGRLGAAVVVTVALEEGLRKANVGVGTAARPDGSGLPRTPATAPRRAAEATSGTSGTARRRRRLERAAMRGPGARVNVPSGRRLKVTVTGRGWSGRTKR